MELNKLNKRRNVVIRAYTLQELANLVYGISKYRLRNLIKKHKKEIGKREGYFYETKQVEVIFSLIPLPSDIDIV